VILLTSDAKVMGDRVSSTIERTLGWVTFAIMGAAALGLLLT
jgi:Mn2+/Fe2+ NRAMP family transporter